MRNKMGTIILIVVLLLAAMLLAIVEICTPTFGILGLLGAGCAAGALYYCYSLNGVFGIIATVIVLIGTPIFLVKAVRILPGTRLGGMLTLKAPSKADAEGTPEAASLAGLVGRQTTTETVLRPSGTIRIDGRRIVARAEGNMIPKGATVKVIRASGTDVVVREVES